ncbi:MAG TPA: cytochrome-c peroxidase, partial [Rhodanobacteraceae bacterium]|nr:cytochrome-c peroxidase [Rhodanobacteraceae bacterium]
MKSLSTFVVSLWALTSQSMPVARAEPPADLDRSLTTVLRQLGFTGKMQSTLDRRLGRSLDPALVDLGQLLWFDSITSLGNDNSCSGCHSPAFGFGDSQSIAIGVENNGIVGPDRAGPRNQRRTPQMINAGFYPG